MTPAAEWLAAAQAVTGRNHARSGLPCQDSAVAATSADGAWVSLVVSDGAGTARRSAEGATFITRYFSDALLALTPQLAERPPGHWLNDYLVGRLLDARERLRSIAGNDDISAFHCTLVACLAGPDGGFVIHIGDGSAFGGRVAVGKTAELNVDRFVSAPANGEYANETYFLTEGNWVKHLRIVPIPCLDWVVVGTDGGSALASTAGAMPRAGFVMPLMREIAAAPDRSERDAALKGLLTDLKAAHLTGDDKALAVAVRRHVAHQGTELLYTDELAVAATAGPVSAVASDNPSSSERVELHRPPKRRLMRRILRALLVVLLVASAWVAGKLTAERHVLAKSRSASASSEQGRAVAPTQSSQPPHAPQASQAIHVVPPAPAEKQRVPAR